MPDRLGEYVRTVLAGSFIGGILCAEAITCICILTNILLCKESLVRVFHTKQLSVCMLCVREGEMVNDFIACSSCCGQQYAPDLHSVRAEKCKYDQRKTRQGVLLVGCVARWAVIT